MFVKIAIEYLWMRITASIFLDEIRHQCLPRDPWFYQTEWLLHLWITVLQIISWQLIKNFVKTWCLHRYSMRPTALLGFSHNKRTHLPFITKFPESGVGEKVYAFRSVQLSHEHWLITVSIPVERTANENSMFLEIGERTSGQLVE